MIGNLFALVRLVIILAIGIAVISVVTASQNHKPIHAPRIVHQLTP